MAEVVQFQILPEQVDDFALIHAKIKSELALTHDDFTFEWRKRSIDARKKIIKLNCSFTVYTKDESSESTPFFSPQNVADKKRIAIIGAGPAGLFAALRCLVVGLSPVVFELGKDVRTRRSN